GLWLAGLTNDYFAAGAAADNLGYTAANKAGDAFTGDVSSTGTGSGLGLVAGLNGIASSGPINPASHTGGSTSIGIPSVLGLNTGANGISLSGSGTPGLLADVNGIATIIRAHTSRFIMTDSTGTSFLADITAAIATFLGAIAAVSATLSGALGAASAVIT